jgi:hypothetical protein
MWYHTSASLVKIAYGVRRGCAGEQFLHRSAPAAARGNHAADMARVVRRLLHAIGSWSGLCMQRLVPELGSCRSASCAASHHSLVANGHSDSQWQLIVR